MKGTSSRKPLPTFPFPYSQHPTYRLSKCLQILFSSWVEKKHGEYETESELWPLPRTVRPVHRHCPWSRLTFQNSMKQLQGKRFLLSPRSAFFPSSCWGVAAKG